MSPAASTPTTSVGRHRAGFSRRRLTALAVCATTAVGAAVVSGTAGAATTSSYAPALKPVLFVGNNWDGTIDVLSGSGDLHKVGRLNAIPDKSDRLAEIAFNPIHWPVFLYIRNTAGEGHDQYVDDTYSTPDGNAVIVSRPSFADVVSIDTHTNKINWRFEMTGFRADHMAIAPDGKRVAVSDSSANKVHVLDMATGKELGKFSTGDRPHENVFSPDGTQIWNMSIGNVENSFDDPEDQRSDILKGKRLITVADANTYQVIKTIDMRDKLDAIGLRDFSDAIRPISFTPDFKKAYFQVSFYNGFFEYDVATDKITRNEELPKNPALTPDRTKWVNDSRHHGMTMKPDGSKLCVAGTMDDYAMVIDRSTWARGPQVSLSKPYWATYSTDGNECVISESGADQVSAIDFATGQKVATVAVGDHPQRVRQGVIAADWTGPNR